MHVKILVKINPEEWTDDQYGIDNLLLPEVERTIDYYSDEDREGPFDWYYINDKLKDLEQEIWAYTAYDHYWISEPTLRELREALQDSDKDRDVFYLVDCHI